MKEKYKKYLPIGSVVLLKEASKRIMITGFAVKGKDDNTGKVYDYIACLYPEGVINTEQNLLFNHDDIQRIFAIGYSDDEEKTFKERLNIEIEKINNNGSN